MPSTIIKQAPASISTNPTKPEQMIKYGTAGFRTTAANMFPIVAKMPAVLARFAQESAPRAVCLVFTASHNHADDNGIKMIGGDGLMAPTEWEVLAEQVANDLFTLEERSLTGTVLVGRDTRASGFALVRVFSDGMQKAFPGIKLIDIGEVTTPQAHYITAKYNLNRQSVNKAKEDYLNMVSISEFHSRHKVVLDCANGVGAIAMTDMFRHCPLLSESIKLVNTSDGILNERCGADHVKTTSSPPVLPSNLNMADYIGASFDGDADRLIMWYFRSPGQFRVLDGDKIACLFAFFFKEHCHLETAVVQTAYSNGASRDYLQSISVHRMKTLTGVKHLHKAAHDLVHQDKYDVVVYFEGNGHGTVLFGDSYEKDPIIKNLINEYNGDAISDLLGVLYILDKLNLSIQEWDDMYQERPTSLSKIPVANQDLFITEANDEEVLVSPANLQRKINEVCGGYKTRAFVRPSGTEPCLRLYVEAETKNVVEHATALLKDLIKTAT